METVEMKHLFCGVYAGRRVLVTGHTGFKGSWLALWLAELGARITGVALDPETTPNHWDILQLGVSDHRVDIRDSAAVSRIIAESQPEIVFHLAAQPLVRRSYWDPLNTWSTNVMGTANVLEACRQAGGVRAIVAITTDKVYADQESPSGYRENDRLGGHDPYSASKAAGELVADSYRKAYFYDVSQPLLATARAGNVIGGGDWSEDRLIPDLVRAVRAGQPLVVRSPGATRPWQHVLECLAGYLLLGQELLSGRRDFAEPWNFGPDPSAGCTVAEMLTKLKTWWPELVWRQTRTVQPHETTLICLDNTKTRTKLGWRPVWTLEQCLSATATWYRAHYETGTTETQRQVSSYVEAARSLGCVWAGE